MGLGSGVHLRFRLLDVGSRHKSQFRAQGWDIEIQTQSLDARFSIESRWGFVDPYAVAGSRRGPWHASMTNYPRGGRL